MRRYLFALLLVGCSSPRNNMETEYAAFYAVIDGKPHREAVVNADYLDSIANGIRSEQLNVRNGHDIREIAANWGKQGDPDFDRLEKELGGIFDRDRNANRYKAEVMANALEIVSGSERRP
jgi:hypothetical protein